VDICAGVSIVRPPTGAVCGIGDGPEPELEPAVGDVGLPAVGDMGLPVCGAVVGPVGRVGGRLVGFWAMVEADADE
jgi:hypothetical protein